MTGMLVALGARRYALHVVLRNALVCASAALLIGCGDAGLPTSEVDGGVVRCDPSLPPTRTISCVDAFNPGPGAGFGQERYPAVIYGDPKGAGPSQGSTDVLSLGMGGEIVFGFGGNAIVDGDGVDLVIFENAFDVGGDPDKPFKDLAEIAVSEDGESWKTFPCKKSSFPYTGCAGWHPVLANDAAGISPFDPRAAGGDGFDLRDVGLTRARLVRIHDLGVSAAPPTAGFDLDAAAIVHEADPGP